MDEPYTVVVGVDGSPTGRDALRWALDEVRARHGRMRAVHAWVSLYDYQMDVISPPDQAKRRAVAQARLDDALAELDLGDIAIEATLVEGDPRHVLVDAARDADLLVVGSHGHGRVAEVVLGSVSTFCVHHAPCPVVVVRGAE
jgi:nucleotide-binding universal stress UspA family protein